MSKKKKPKKPPHLLAKNTPPEMWVGNFQQPSNPYDKRSTDGQPWGSPAPKNTNDLRQALSQAMPGSMKGTDSHPQWALEVRLTVTVKDHSDPANPTLVGSKSESFGMPYDDGPIRFGTNLAVTSAELSKEVWQLNKPSDPQI